MSELDIFSKGIGCVEEVEERWEAIPGKSLTNRETVIDLLKQGDPQKQQEN